MNRDILFMLYPESVKTEEKWRYCPDCALIAGYLSFYPAVERALDIRFVAPPRPRATIIALLGEDHQGAPVLVLDTDSPSIPGITYKEANGWRFIDEPKDILAYLGARHSAGGLPL